MPAALPDWITRVPGRRPILLVAPHGGRRPEESELSVERARKVNDLGTAELTMTIAARAGATAIVNHAEDRNRLDLNRVSHLRERAPWLLDLLAETVRAQVEAAGRSLVVFVHGWNAIQPVCDVGVGARLEGDRLVGVKQGVPTVGPAFLPRLLRFADACRADGIHLTFGDRYPAAGRENALQMFTSRYAADPHPAIRELAALGASGRVPAVQLELAVPLRWPGALRDRLIERLVDFLGDERPEAAAGSSAWTPAIDAAPERLSLDFHDPAAGLGGFLALERTGLGRRHARFLLCLGRSRIGLFTGEDGSLESEAISCAGLRCRRDDDGGLAIQYRGPYLVFPRSDPFLDLEAGLASSELTALEAGLEWRPLAPAPAQRWSKAEGGARLGRLAGEISLGGSRSRIAAVASLDTGPPVAAAPWNERRVLRASFADESFLAVSSLRSAEERVEGEILRGGITERLLSGRVELHRAADGRTPEAWRVEVVDRRGPLRLFGRVTAAVPVVRATSHGRVLWHFGLVRFQGGDAVGHGTFEVARRLGPGGVEEEE